MYNSLFYISYLLSYILFFFVWAKNRESKVFVKFLPLMFTLAIVLLTAFRPYGLGDDDINYMRIFHNVSQKTWGDVIGVSNFFVFLNDYFFNLYLKLLSILGVNRNTFILVNSVISLSLLVFSFYRLVSKDSRVLVVTLFFFMTNAELFFGLFFHHLRNGIAVSLFLMGLSYYMKGNLRKFFLCSFISIGFHSSMVVVLLIPLLNSFLTSAKKRNIALIFFLALLVPFNFQDLIFSKLSVLFSGSASFNNQLEGRFSGAVSLMSFKFIKVLFLFLLCNNLVSLRNQDQKNRVGLFLNVYLLGIIFYLAFKSNAIFCHRLSRNFFIVEPLLISSIYIFKSKIGDKHIHFVFLSLLILFFLIKFLLSVSGQ